LAIGKTSFAPYRGEKMEPMSGLEPETSSLPRTRSAD
jgi:hypothetical protein